MSQNPFDLTGRVPLSPGTSRGLGQYFAQRNWPAPAPTSVITSRDPATLTAFRAEIEALGRQALPLRLEVRSSDSIQARPGRRRAPTGKD